ncbi:MAG: hypothetical protein VYC34_02055 [Planctomycetota bacterium]|nr:hypothetical protein [Planctomycetota bacterium]
MPNPSPPASPHHREQRPTSLTFFLTPSQRSRILAALRAHHPDRTTALALALNVQPAATPADKESAQ